MAVEAPALFDRDLWRARRERAAAGFDAADFLHRNVAAEIAERLEEVNRGFPDAAVIGAGTGLFAQAIAGRFGVERLTQIDAAPAMAARAAAACPAARTLIGDEEALPLASQSLDLIIGGLTLHWTNDLVGALIQIRRALRPDGLFIGALPAGGTLNELRTALAGAEIAIEGGLSPRVAPMAELRDLGGLLQRAGFALPVTDADRLIASYASPRDLMRDLRAMGETNALTTRRKAPLRRATLARAGQIYAENFAGPDGRIRATFEMVYLTGWAPHENQQKPMRPGSASARLADALGTVEIPAGDRAGR